MYSIIALYFAIYLLPIIIVNVLQIYHIKSYATQEPVILNQHDYSIAATYAIIKCKITIIQHIVNMIFLILWLLFGIESLSHFVVSIGVNGAFQLDWSILMCFMAVNLVLNLPFSFVIMRVDTVFGFNKQSLASFCVDTVKTTIISGIFIGVIFALLLWAMETFALWWVVSFVLVFCFIILIQFIYPTLIAPMFNKFTPLQNETLRERIHNLMLTVGFKSNGIFVMDASKRDGRLNAYFGGLGKSKRVVLFDTLLDKISEDGLIAILGHELGHFKHGDIIRNIILGGCIFFCLFAIMGLFFQDICVYIGLQETHSNILIVAILLLPALTFFITPIQSYFSRKAEYRADLFGASCASKKTLSETLIRLVNENKTFPYSHPAYVFFYLSHPPLIDRLNALKDYERKETQ
ncbi:M48 family peptidase [Helicobacter aurati]|uniref:M48 family peptidase n=1 Tax=Helicobacter aurati TaxID=137778 RepID=A0A3D8IZC8_9HELI|nr:M48 family metallopeptidase [Helicobacter aurati]RDU70632.1 M48 family peptidase [Helicobacter aurati]